MQKKLIAVAVAGLVSGAAFAQSNVTIYGQVRVSVDRVDLSTQNQDRMQVSDEASRIGFKGAEDLGNGLKAVWQWESALNTTNSTTIGTTQRNTFLGLAGGFGTVLAGTHDTPYKLGGSADLFGDTAADAQCNGSTTVTCVIGRNGYDNRLTNVLAYISPTWGGFHFAVAGVAGEEAGGTPANNDAKGLADAYSMVGVYEAGPVKATLGYEARKAEFISSTATDGEKATGLKANIKGTFGPIGVGYTHERSTDVSYSASSRKKDKGNLLSVSYAMGSTVLGAQIGRFDDTDTADQDLKTWTIGAYHNLSKRTQAYVGYHNGDLKNGSGTDNLKAKVLTAGLNHNF